MIEDVAIGQTALKTSIRDWEEMRENVNSGMNDLIAYDKKPYCALCIIYRKFRADEDCKGCPVMKKTGHWACLETPFYTYMKFRMPPHNHTKEEILKAIDAEIDFLKGLVNDE